MKKSMKILISSLLAISLIFGATLSFSDAASTSTTKTIEKLKKQVKSLTASNKKKDAEIKKLKAQVKKKDKEIKDLKAQLSPSKSSQITLAEFNKLKNGMTYKEAVEIIGGKGTVISEFQMDNYKSVTYEFAGNGDYSSAVLNFTNNKLDSKTQYGLK